MIYDTPTQRAEHRSSVPVNDAKTQQYSFYLLVWLKCCEKNTDFYKIHILADSIRVSALQKS